MSLGAEVLLAHAESRAVYGGSLTPGWRAGLPADEKTMRYTGAPRLPFSANRMPPPASAPADRHWTRGSGWSTEFARSYSPPSAKLRRVLYGPSALPGFLSPFSARKALV